MYLYSQTCCFRQGKIACANVVSDLYAVGVSECDNMLMLLAISTKLTDKERDVVVPLMIRGFRVSVDACPDHRQIFTSSNSVAQSNFSGRKMLPLLLSQFTATFPVSIKSHPSVSFLNRAALISLLPSFMASMIPSP